MSELETLFCSRTRAGLLSCLFGTTPAKLHLRAIVREVDVSVGSVQQDLKHLISLHLIISERDGNRLYYIANIHHPLYPSLREIVARTTGIYEILRKSLNVLAIQYAYVFGSTAVGTAKTSSDLDLMVIGSASLRTLASCLSEASNQIGREINPHVMTLDEYLKRCADGEHFICSVINTKRDIIMGDMNELGNMEKQRLAQRAQHI